MQVMTSSPFTRRSFPLSVPITLLPASQQYSTLHQVSSPLTGVSTHTVVLLAVEASVDVLDRVFESKFDISLQLIGLIGV